MVIPDIVLRKLAVVLLLFSFHKIRCKAFLKKNISHILLILQNAEDSRLSPDTRPARRGNVSILQKALDFPQTVSIQIALRDLTNDLCLLGDNLRFSVRSLPVSQKPVVPKYKPSLPVSHADSLCDVSADGFALGLRERAQTGQNHLAVHVGGINGAASPDTAHQRQFLYIGSG